MSDDKNEKVMCGFCKLFFTKDELSVHIRDVHNDSKKFSCHLCAKKSFSNLISLQYHIAVRHDAVKKFPCSRCDKKYMTAWELATHISKSHKGICEICGKVLKNNHQRNLHVMKVHEKVKLTKCLNCGSKYKFSKEGSNRDHYFITVNDAEITEYHCHFCDKSFKEEEEVNKHVEKGHGDIEKYICGKCVSSFSCNVVLIRPKISANPEDIKIGDFSHENRILNKIKKETDDYWEDSMEIEEDLKSASDDFEMEFSDDEDNNLEEFENVDSDFEMKDNIEFEDSGSAEIQNSNSFENRNSVASESVENKASKTLKVQDSEKFEIHDSEKVEIHDSEKFENQDSETYENLDSKTFENQDSETFENLDSETFENLDSETFDIQDSKSFDIQDSETKPFVVTPEIPDSELLEDNDLDSESGSIDLDGLMDDPDEIDDVKVYVCKICNRSYIKPSDLEKHMLKVHESKLYVCLICKTFTEKESNYKLHMSKVHKRIKSSITTYNCEICGKSNNRKNNFVRHMKLMHGKTAKVENTKDYDAKERALNGKDYLENLEVDADGLMAPMEIEGTKIYVCKVCYKSYERPTDLQKHAFKVHEDNNIFICTKCGKFTYTKSSFQIHIVNSHKWAKAYICDICGMSCRTKTYQRRHMKTVHNITLDHTNTQIISSNKVNFASSHKNVVTKNNKPLEIDYNLENEVDSDGLMKPVEVDGVKVYVCKVCHMTYKRSMDFKAHMFKIHKDPNVYICQRCEKFTYEKSSFETHVVNVHKGTTTYVCDICGKSSRCRYNHKRHMRVIHKKTEDNFITKVLSTNNELEDEVEVKEEVHETFEIIVTEKSEAEIDESRVTEDKDDLNDLEIEIDSGKSITKLKKKDKIFACDICGKSFDRKTNLKRHVRLIHTEKDDKDLKSKKCLDPLGIHSDNLIEPEKVDGVITYVCQYCNRNYKRPTDFKNHLVKAHNDTTIYYFCNFCGKYTDNNVDYESHMSLNEAKVFVCDICGKSSQTLSNHTRHMFSMHIKPMANDTKIKSLADTTIIH